MNQSHCTCSMLSGAQHSQWLLFDSHRWRKASYFVGEILQCSCKQCHPRENVAPTPSISSFHFLWKGCNPNTALIPLTVLR